MPLIQFTCSPFRLFICGAIFLAGTVGLNSARGQSSESSPDTTLGTWTYDATARLNASQAAYSNWQEGGGNNSLAFTTALDAEAVKRSDFWIQSYRTQLAFGLIDQESQEIRKAEDRIRLNISLRYDGEGFFRLFNPTIAGRLRTQFASGFDYDEDPPVENSAFFAPAFITESIGLTYEPRPSFTIRLGIASKQTVVTEPAFRPLYDVDPDNTARVEAGAELVSSYDKRLTENIRYQSQLNVFFSINQTEDPPDTRWENAINLKVNDWLSTDLTFEALFDRDISRAIQLKETVSVGVSFTLL